ncbi:MAG: hypothetical protein ACUVV0_16220 [Anaerolineae bacterium]
MEQISINIADEELLIAAQTEAQKHGRNLSEIVERLLEIWLEAVEDAADIADSEAALEEGGESILWERVRQEISARIHTLKQLIEAIEQLTPEEASLVLAALRRREEAQKSLTLEAALEQLARAIEQLAPDELETLSILIDPELKQELLRRREQARREMAEGKLLSVEEAFASGER